MRIKITENQHKFIKEMWLRQNLKEQEFLAQQTRVNIGEGEDIGRNWYTIEVSILTEANTISDVELDQMDDRTYFNALLEDAKNKIKEAFNTTEYDIQNISTKARGSMRTY
ncbi:MAG: hypothetical protein WC389_20925 [Lutibacter sp.]|jgi:HrpA-like RNA helicase